MTVGLVDRAIRRSVDRAAQMQPRRVQQSVDETLFASPGQKPDVERLRMAARLLDGHGLSVPGFTLLALRRSDNAMTATRRDADFSNLDARSLVTLDLREPASEDLPPSADKVIPMIGDARAIVIAHPAALLALGAIPDGEEHGLGHDCQLWNERGVGTIAIGDDPVTLVEALAAAERTAQIHLNRRTT